MKRLLVIVLLLTAGLAWAAQYQVVVSLKYDPAAPARWDSIQATARALWPGADPVRFDTDSLSGLIFTTATARDTSRLAQLTTQYRGVVRQATRTQ